MCFPVTIPEVKTVDTAFSLRCDVDSDVAYNMKLLNTIPTGNTSNSRVGRKVELKGLQIKATVYSATATKQTHVAVALVWVRNPNKAATLPATTDIFVSQSSISLTNRDNASNFKIVRRWDWHIIGNSTTPSTGAELFPFDEYINFKAGKYTSSWTQTSTTGVIADFEQGALILVSLGDAVYGATTTVLATGNARCYYIDA